MSIEQTLERIAVGIEKLIEMQRGATAPAPVAAAPSPVTQMPGPQSGPPIQAGPPVAQGPAPIAPAPIAPAPVAQMPGPSGTGPGQVVPPPVGGPVAGDLKDQIREAANAFHRAHPERAGEVWQILTNAGSTGGIDQLPPTAHAAVLQQIQALGA